MSNQQSTSYKALIKMTNAITSSLDTDKMMQCIVDEVVSVLPFAEAGALYLFDHDTGKLMSQSIVGFPKEYCKTAAFEPGKSLSGRVFFSGQPEMINGLEKCRETILSMPEHHVKNYLNCTKFFPYSIMSAPLKVNSKVIGVLTVDNYNYPEREFFPEDLELLQAAANHVSIVITKSQMIQKEKIYRQQLEAANIELKKGVDFLEQTLLIHKKLTKIVLNGKGFQEIVNFLQEMIGHPVEVFDLYLRPLVFPNDEKHRKLPENLMELPEMKDVLRKWQWQEIELKETQEKCYIFPVVGTEKLLGFVSVWTPENLSDSEFVALNYSSTVLALEWLKQEEIFEAVQRINGKFLRDVLFSDWNNQLMTRANQLGFDPKGFFGIILIKPGLDEPGMSLEKESPVDNCKKLITNLLEIKNLKGIVIQEKNYFCILISFAEDICQNFEEKMVDLAENIAQFHKTFQVGIGSIYRTLIKCKKSYEEARECLSLLDTYSLKSQTLKFKDLGVFRLILKGEQSEVYNFIKDTLYPLVEYDQEKKSDLLLTLQLYVKYNRSLNSIAKDMNLHNNTVYYRIKKVEELLNADLNNQNVWFGIQAACSLMEAMDLEMHNI